MSNPHYRYLVETKINGEWVNTSLPVSLNAAKKMVYSRCKSDRYGGQWRYVRDWHMTPEDYTRYTTIRDRLRSIEGDLSKGEAQMLKCITELCERYESKQTTK